MLPNEQSLRATFGDLTFDRYFRKGLADWTFEPDVQFEMLDGPEGQHINACWRYQGPSVRWLIDVTHRKRLGVVRKARAGWTAKVTQPANAAETTSTDLLAAQRALICSIEYGESAGRLA